MEVNLVRAPSTQNFEYQVMTQVSDVNIFSGQAADSSEGEEDAESDQSDSMPGNFTVTQLKELLGAKQNRIHELEELVKDTLLELNQYKLQAKEHKQELRQKDALIAELEDGKL